MLKIKTRESAAVIYSLFFIIAHSTLRHLVFNPWLEIVNLPFKLYKHLFTLSFLGLYAVPFGTILDKKEFGQWRKTMKKNFWGWATIIACSMSFAVLMVEICSHMENVGEIICVVIAASIIFIPNLWVLICLVSEKYSTKSKKTGDSSVVSDS